MTTKQYMITVLGGGRGYTLEDTDLWGLLCALEHGLLDGYFENEGISFNRDWAKAMVNRLQILRGLEDGDTTANL